MSAPHEKLIEDVASSSRMDPLIIRKVICNYQNSVAMPPALFALLGDLRPFFEYPLDRLRVPFVVIDLLTVRHLEHVAVVVFDRRPTRIQKNARAHNYDLRPASPV